LPFWINWWPSNGLLSIIDYHHFGGIRHTHLYNSCQSHLWDLPGSREPLPVASNSKSRCAVTWTMGLPAMHQFGYGSRAGILDDFGTCWKMLEYDGKSWTQKV
jgi:hypothetical protein